MARFCPRCGRPAADGLSFCEGCGAPLQGSAAAPVSPNPPVNLPPQGAYATGPYSQVPYPGYQAPAPKKSKTGLIAGISVGAAALAALALILLFVKPGYLKKNNEPADGGGTAYLSVQSSGSHSNSASQSGGAASASQSTAQTAPPDDGQAQSGTASVTETDPEPEENASAGSGSDGGTASSGTSAVPNDSDVGRPVHADFDWLQDIVFRDTYPTGSTIFRDTPSINGRWKGMFLFTEGSEISVAELLNAEIMAGDRAATVVIDPYMINFDNSEYEDESDMNDYSFDGAIDDGSINCFSDFGNLELRVFFSDGTKQYGLGYLTVQSGEQAYVGLVRP